MIRGIVPSTRVLASIAVGVIVAGVGVWAQTPALIGSGYDDGIYVLIARALANGHGFQIIHLPGAEVPAIKYPPVYPLTLVPFWLLASTQEAALHWMKLANGLALGVAAAFFTLLLVQLRVAPAPLAALLSLVAFVSGSMMLMTTTLLSEPLYLALLFPVLWLADRARPMRSTAFFVSLGVLAGLVFLTRTIGIALIAAVVIGLWRRAGCRNALTTAGSAGLTVLPWLVYSAVGAARVPELLVPRYGSYLQLYMANLAGSPTAAIGIFSTNLGAILQTAGAKIISSTPFFDSLAGVGLIGLALLGSLRLARHAPATAIYPWIYLGLVAFWSFPPFRFLFALFPLLLALAVVSCRELAGFPVWTRSGSKARSSRRQSLRAIAILAVGGLLLLNLTVRGIRSVAARVWEPGQMQVTEVSLQVIRWVNQHTTMDDVVAFEFDPLLALYTDRPTIPNTYAPVHVWYRREPTPIKATVRLWCELGLDYVAVRRDIPAAAEPIDRVIEQSADALKLVHVTSKGALIFRFVPAALGSGHRSAGVAGSPAAVPKREDESGC